MPAKFDAVRKRSHSRSGSNRKRYRWNLRGSENGAGDASGATLNGRLDHSGIERRDEERAPGRVGRDCFAIGEGNLHTRREPAIDVQNGQSGAFASDELARHKQDARAGRRRSLLSGADCGEKEQGEKH